MAKIPTQLETRLQNIFSKEEMKMVEKAFTLKKRPVTFRINTLKSSENEVEDALAQASITYTKLKFPQDSYILDDTFSESDLWKRRVYKDWKIYIQWLASQTPVNFFSQEKPLKILDACAAPGGKTSQLAALYPDAEIYAFEPFKVRYEKMQHNLKKLWCNNVTAIHDEIRNIWTYIESEDYFDMILVDAPCSSEGSISTHNDKFLKAWDISHIKKNYKRQKHIIDDVLPYLKQWWELIYSTCTLAPEENEWVIHYALCNYPELELQDINIDENIYITTKQALRWFEKYTYRSEISEKNLRVIPGKYSEGFFIAKLLKTTL